MYKMCVHFFLKTMYYIGFILSAVSSIHSKALNQMATDTKGLLHFYLWIYMCVCMWMFMCVRIYIYVIILYI